MLEVGSLVRSIRGHDTDRIYVVVGISGEFVTLVDGKYRKHSNPKKKRLKHIKDTFVKCNQDISKMYDYEIATFIKNSGVK